jgi:hypothetical protein
MRTEPLPIRFIETHAHEALFTRLSQLDKSAMDVPLLEHTIRSSPANRKELRIKGNVDELDPKHMGTVSPDLFDVPRHRLIAHSLPNPDSMVFMPVLPFLAERSPWCLFVNVHTPYPRPKSVPYVHYLSCLNATEARLPSLAPKGFSLVAKTTFPPN